MLKGLKVYLQIKKRMLYSVNMKKFFSFIFVLSFLFLNYHSIDHIVDKGHDTECYVCSSKNDKGFLPKTTDFLVIKNFYSNDFLPEELTLHFSIYYKNKGIRAPPYFS